MPMVGFDTETTGVDPATARIITATATVHDGNGTSSQHWLIDPGIPIPPAATAVHGITDQMVAKGGMEPADALTEILAALEKASSEGKPLVIMNARYDLQILEAELDRITSGHAIELALSIPPVIDPLVLDRYWDPYRKGSRTLTALAHHYGVRDSMDGAHSSDWDAETAVLVARAILEKFGANMTPDELHHKQEIWGRDQAISLREYWKTRGNERWKTVQIEWPGLTSPDQ